MDRKNYFIQLLDALKIDIVERRTVLQGGPTLEMKRFYRTKKSSLPMQEGIMTGLIPTYSRNDLPVMYIWSSLVEVILLSIFIIWRLTSPCGSR